MGSYCRKYLSIYDFSCQQRVTCQLSWMHSKDLRINTELQQWGVFSFHQFIWMSTNIFLMSSKARGHHCHIGWWHEGQNTKCVRVCVHACVRVCERVFKLHNREWGLSLPLIAYRRKSCTGQWRFSTSPAVSFPNRRNLSCCHKLLCVTGLLLGACLIVIQAALCMNEPN